MAKTWTFYKNGCKMDLSMDLSDFNVTAVLTLMIRSQLTLKT